MVNRRKKQKKILQIVITLESILILILLSVLIIPKIFKTKEESFEIEKKWLIRQEDIPYDLSKAEVYEIRQTYISFSPEIRVRDINDGSFYILTIKTDDPAFKGLKRTEQEYYITKKEYSQLLTKKEGSTIHKTRYRLSENNNIIEIAIFHDQLDGLAYMEIEFPSTESANNFKDPDWVLKDITTDMSYKNGHLAKYGLPDSFKQYLNERSNNE